MPAIAAILWGAARSIASSALAAGVRLLPRAGAAVTSVAAAAARYPHLTTAAMMAGAAAVDLVADVALIEAMRPESKVRRNRPTDPAAWAALMSGQPVHIGQLWR